MVIEKRAAGRASLGWLGPSPAGGAVRLLSWAGQSGPASLFEAGAVGERRHPEDHELRRLHRRHADLDGEDAHVPVLRRVVLLVPLAEERLRRALAEHRAVTPPAAQDPGDGA